MVGGETGILGEWGVERPDNEYEGAMTTRDALVKGKNSATVRLGMKTGLEALKKRARRQGSPPRCATMRTAFSEAARPPLTSSPSPTRFFRTAGSVQPRRASSAGSWILKGKVIYESPRKMVHAIAPSTAFQVSMPALPTSCSAAPARVPPELGSPRCRWRENPGPLTIFTDTYFFGYTNAVTCGVWVGFDKPTKIFRGAFGKDLALPIWTKIMNAAAKPFPPLPVSKPSELQEVEICRTSGLLATPKCTIDVTDAGGAISSTQPLSYTEYATANQMPQIRCDIHGGGVRNYAKQFDEAGWPRAATAVDLSTIRPVAVFRTDIARLQRRVSGCPPGHGAAR